MEDQDRAIIEDVLAGRTHRFRLLVERHQQRAMTLAVRLLADRQEAEEAVQDAFVQAYKALGTFRGSSSVGTWLYRILYNGCLTRLRRRRTMPAELELSDAETSDDAQATDLQAERAAMQEILGQEMDALASHYRTALTLFYVQEMKYEEIAEVMNVPLASVKTYLFRGKQRLRARLVRRLGTEVES